MPGMQIKIIRRLRARTYAGFAVLTLVLPVLIGCATDGNIKTLDIRKPSVARLEDGREGFIITEVPKMDAVV